LSRFKLNHKGNWTNTGWSYAPYQGKCRKLVGGGGGEDAIGKRKKISSFETLRIGRGRTARTNNICGKRNGKIRRTEVKGGNQGWDKRNVCECRGRKGGGFFHHPKKSVKIGEGKKIRRRNWNKRDGKGNQKDKKRGAGGKGNKKVRRKRKKGREEVSGGPAPIRKKSLGEKKKRNGLLRPWLSR